MNDPVAAAYDANAELYASLFRDELANDAQTLRMLLDLAGRASRMQGPVVDVGCGPGAVVAHLADLGLSSYGIDLSAGQVEQARLAFAAHRFEVGDLTALDVADGTLGGIVSKYSVIHLDPSRLGGVFAEWRRALEPEAPMFLSFFGARSAEGHAEPFDHKVVTAYALWPATVVEILTAAGFVDIEIEATPIPVGGRPYDHVTILARAGGG